MMPGFRLPLRSAGRFGPSLVDLPGSIKSAIGHGFKLFEHIPEQTSSALIEAAIQGLIGRDVDVPVLARRLDLPEGDVGDAVSALAMVLIAVAGENISPDSFVEDAISAGLFPESDRALVSRIATTVSTSREDIKIRLDRENITRGVLPSLTKFQSEVELRLGFKEDRVWALVPVAVAYLDTDATHVELWFQMSKAQVESLAKDLQDLLRRMEQAEKLTESIKLP